MREGGEPIGYVDYLSREDMERAIRRLDDSEFRNPFDKAFVRVKEIKRCVGVGVGGGLTSRGFLTLAWGFQLAGLLGRGCRLGR
jgi:hypothetical protein